MKNKCMIDFNYLVEFISKCIDTEKLISVEGFDFYIGTISIAFTKEYIEVNGFNCAHMQIPHTLSYDESQTLNKLVTRVEHLNESKMVEQLKNFF